MGRRASPGLGAGDRATLNFRADLYFLGEAAGLTGAGGAEGAFVIGAGGAAAEGVEGLLAAPGGGGVGVGSGGLMPTSSTSKSRVEFGPISLPTARSP